MSYFKAAIIGFLLVQSLTAAEIPTYIPSSQNLFAVARELYGRKLIDHLEYADPSRKPGAARNDFERKLIANYLYLIRDYSNRRNEPTISYGLELVLANRQKKANSSYPKIFPKVRIDPCKNLSATIIYRIDNELTDDARYDGKSWNGWAGFAENATVDFSYDKMKFGFGFERVSWGLGKYGNLLFSRQALPMVVIRFAYISGKLDFESLSGFLSPLGEELVGPIDDPGYFTDQQRYIAAHSLSFKAGGGLSLSVRETVVYGGPGRRFEPAYAFPLIWYHGYQLNSGMDDNTLAAAGFDYRRNGKIWLYGEILVDDFQIEKKTNSDNEPDQLAFLLGGEAYDLGKNGTGIRVEYARINNWVYNQPRSHNRLINRNFPIGFPDGPDNDIVNWECSWWPIGSVRLVYFGAYQRVGEGRIDSPWTAPWLDTDEYSEPFPTGTVQRKVTNGLSVLVMDKKAFWGKMELQLADIRNAGNIPAIKTEWEFSVEIGCNLPPFSREL